MESIPAAVVDSSVLLKWFRPHEPLAPIAQALRQAYLEERMELAIPDLALYEVANVLRHRASESLALQAVESLFDLRIPIHRFDQPLLQQVIRAAYRYQITVYDAVFVAAAERLRWPLVTADHPLARAVAQRSKVIFLADL